MIVAQDKFLAKKLRSLRLEKDFLQKNMALLLGLESQQDYSKLERGQKHFSDKIIDEICKVFKIEKEFFVESELTIQTKSIESEYRKDILLTQEKLIKTLESQINANKLNELYLLKAHLEKELALVNQLLEEKLMKKVVFFNELNQKYYVCVFL